MLRMAQLALGRLLHSSIVRLSDCSTDAHYNQVHPAMLQPGLIVIPKQTALAGKLELPTLRLTTSRFKQLHYGSKLFAGPITQKPMDRHHSPRIRRCPQAHAHLFPEYKFYTTTTSLQEINSHASGKMPSQECWLCPLVTCCSYGGIAKHLVTGLSIRLGIGVDVDRNRMGVVMEITIMRLIAFVPTCTGSTSITHVLPPCPCNALVLCP